MVARLAEQAPRLGSLGDVASDALQLGEFAGIGADQPFAPGDPARASGGRDLLIVAAGAVVIDGGFALFDHRQGMAAAEQVVARVLCQIAIGVVDECDGAVGSPQHDQVALQLEQAAGPLLGFLQFPVAVDQPLVVKREPVHLAMQPSHPQAQGRQGDAGGGEQRADAMAKVLGS